MVKMGTRKTLAHCADAKMIDVLDEVASPFRAHTPRTVASGARARSRPWSPQPLPGRGREGDQRVTEHPSHRTCDLAGRWPHRTHGGPSRPNRPWRPHLPDGPEGLLPKR